MSDPSPPFEAAKPLTAFDYTEDLLKSGDYDIVDLSRPRSYIETKSAVYAIVETDEADPWRIYGQYADATHKAKKNFVVVGFYLDEIRIGQIADYISMASAFKLRGVVASTQLQLKRVIAELEGR